ncbi:MAG TPA: N-acetylmuramoyl-L-alanine amidase [Gammaproteobacteria bacterium]|jgi:N-acetylmuramoyl-L-alanine amidase|nr:N-acetylmuramoyl-L-alanine amidase [Gammaproteobacteria bacterium]
MFGARKKKSTVMILEPHQFNIVGVLGNTQSNLLLSVRQISLLVFMLLLGASLSVQSAVVDRFTVQNNAQNLNLVFHLDARPDHKIFKLTNPDRVVLDLKATEIAHGLELQANHQAPIDRIRYATRADGLLRVVLDTSRQVDVLDQVRKSSSGFELVISLRKSGVIQSKEVKVTSVKAAPQQSKARTQVRHYRDLIIAIDAGHGGKDPGAIGKKGTYEKDVVLKIARDLHGLVSKEPGYQSVLIRKKDVFLSLRERIERARNLNADLFISIHADAADNRKATGSSVYVLSQHGASSEAAKRLAQRENAVDLLGGVSLKDKEDTLAHVLLDLTQRHTQDVSYAVANSVRAQLGEIGALHRNRVEKAGFVVLKSPDIPSILVETAFISNRADEKRLLSSKFQKKLAKSLLMGVKNYFYKHAADDTIIAVLRKREHIIRSGETLSGIASRYKIRTTSLRQYNKLKSDVLRIGQILKIPVSET